MKRFIILVFCIFNLVIFGNNEYNKKVYLLEISEKEFFNVIDVNDKQKNYILEVFNNSKREAEKIEKKLMTFNDKMKEIKKIEKNKYNKISNILSEEQFNHLKQYIDFKKNNFKERINKTYELLKNINLSNRQKYLILKLERNFKRNIKKINPNTLSNEDFYKEFIRLRNEKNEKIKSILTEEQLNILNSF